MKVEIYCDVCGTQKILDAGSERTHREAINLVNRIIKEDVLSHRCSGKYKIRDESLGDSASRENTKDSV